jgi:hypothetical protein
MAKTGGDGRPPARDELATRLGRSDEAFERLLAALPRVRQEWRTYGRPSGWVLKLLQGTRTMCYVQPADGSFRVTVVLGQAAADAALASALSPAVKDALRAARVYVEGRSVAVDVSTTRHMDDVLLLLAAKRA